MENNTLRSRQILNALVKKYPNSPKLIDMFRLSRGKDLPKWPAWCFLPMAAWYGIVCDGLGVKKLDIIQSADIAKLAAVLTWRYSQGVYRFDSEVFKSLTETELSGEIPAEVLYRLPEWSVYIETPGRTYFNQKLYGFWSHLEWDANTERHELRFLMDCDEKLSAFPIHLGPWSLKSAIEKAVAESEKNLRGTLDQKEVITLRLVEELNPLLSLLLYLCSSEPEILADREPGKSPARPKPKKTKNGWRLFPPNKTTIWTVGEETGRVLRSYNDQSNSGEAGRTVKPHLRRAHWHGYWLGPRSGEQKFIYRWLPPILII